MSEQNTSSVESNGTVESNDAAKIYTTHEEAQANRPASAKADAWKVFCVTKPNGEQVYVWGFTGINAVNTVARADGYQVEAATRKSRGPAVITKEVVAAKLAAFSDEDLAILGLKRAPVKTPKAKS